MKPAHRVKKALAGAMPFTLLLTCALLTACSEDASGDGGGAPNSSAASLSCAAASLRACPCVYGGMGNQTCLPTGDGYGPCQGCPPAPVISDDVAMDSDTADGPLDSGAADGLDAAMADAGMAGDGGLTADAGGDGGEPMLDEIAEGTSCGVGLPVQCELETEKCCARSLRTDTCIGAAEACTCDLGDCTVMEAHCDGPEDCPDGQSCCGTLAGGSRYERFECATSCDYAGTQRIACHQADPQCPAGTECANSQLLTNVQVCIDPASIRQ